MYQRNCNHNNLHPDCIHCNRYKNSIPNKELQPTEYYAEIERKYFDLLEKTPSMIGNAIGRLTNEKHALEKLLEFYRSVEWYHDGTATEKPETCLGCRKIAAEKEYEQTIKGLNNASKG